MAKKKTKKRGKKITRKRAVKKGNVAKKAVRVTGRKIKLAWKNLLIFAILSFVSYMLMSVSRVEIYINLFFLLTLLLGFVSLAFFLVLLVFGIMKLMRR